MTGFERDVDSVLNMIRKTLLKTRSLRAWAASPEPVHRISPGCATTKRDPGPESRMQEGMTSNPPGNSDVMSRRHHHLSPGKSGSPLKPELVNMGALTIRIGFWAPL